MLINNNQIPFQTTLLKIIQLRASILFTERTVNILKQQSQGMPLPANLSIFVWYCLTNTATTVLPIIQDNHHPRSRPSKTFYHPLMQTEVCIIAEMFCMFAYLFSKEQKRVKTKPRVTILACVLVLIVDLTATSLELFAMNFLSGSVYSITSSIVIISCAFFTKVILKKTFKRAQIAGCLFAVVGVFLAGFSEYTQGTSDTPKDLFLLGLVLTLIAFTIEGLENVMIEIVYAKYDVTPNEFVGIMGTIGTIFWTSLMVGVGYLGCPLNEEQCVQDYQGGYHLQHFPSYFRDLSGDPFLITMLIVNLLAIARVNYDISRVISTASAMVYQVVTIFSNLFIWAVGIIVTLIWSGDQELQIESIGAEVILIKMLGFVLSTIGLLLYNEVIFKGEKEEGGEVQALVVNEEWNEVEGRWNPRKGSIASYEDISKHMILPLIYERLSLIKYIKIQGHSWGVQQQQGRRCDQRKI